MLHISAFRFIGRGHAQRVLRRRSRAPFHNRYDQFVGDQRERLNAILQNIKYEKDAVARALQDTHQKLATVFSFEEAQRLLETQSADEKNDAVPSMESRAEINEAYRIHRLLRPDAPNFFEEQSFINLKQRMDKIIDEHHTECFKEVVPTSGDCGDDALDRALEAMGDPGFSDDTYALGIYALMDSLNEDMKHFCRLLGLDGNHGNNPFDQMVTFLSLKRDGSNIVHWAHTVWPKVKPFLAAEFSSIGTKDVEAWLTSHIERVKHNRSVLNRPNSSEWYDIKRDLPYDAIPYPDALLDERRAGYPLDKAASYLMGMIRLFDQSRVGSVTTESLEDLIDALRKIGLKDWFGLNERDILTTFFGQLCADDTDRSGAISGLHEIILTEETHASCAKLLNLFSQRREHELEKEILSPLKIFRRHLDNVGPNDESVSSLTIPDSRSMLSQDDIDTIVTEYVKKLRKLSGSKVARDYNSVFDRMIKEELEFHSNVGAGTVTEDGIDYKVPAGAQFDAKRNYYVRTREGVDPTLKLENLRSCVLERKRMRTMTKEGRVYFLRVVAAVGDGKGYFGTGVGFGNDVATARGSAVQQALRNMYFIDFDPKEPLTTPVLGREYGSKVYITPRKMGSGIKTNRKFLPLVYLTGLDNCKVSFHGRSSWLTRAKALRKALEQIYSRRTMCNATGMKYVYVDNPGDHTVHWPDRWFIPMSKEYKDKTAALKNLKRVHFRRHANRVVLPEEVAPGIPNYARHKFRSPLEVRENERKRLQYISTKIANAPEPTTEKAIEPML